MALFLLASALLVAMALFVVLAPLWRDSRPMALFLVLALPLGTAGLYWLLGTPAALDPANVVAPRTLDDAVDQLQRRLAEEPGQVEGWLLLGRSRMAQKRFIEARDAFARAHALVPEEVDVMVEYADAQLRAAPDGQVPEAAAALLEKAVERQPNHQRGLFFLGVQRMQAGRPAEAVALWERLLPLLDPDTRGALEPQIRVAREAAGLPPAEPATPAAADTAGPGILLTVDLAPALAAQLAEGDTLFVFARTPDGAGLPVAVRKLPARDFPVQVRLSDADGLMPTQKLSAQARVRLMARVSRTGDAAAVAGDFEAEPLLLDVSEGATARLTIDRVHP